MEKYLWKFFWDCGRSGRLESLFVATYEEVKEIIGLDAYFGSVLGKHSEIEGTMQEEDFTKIDLASETVEKVSKILGSIWSGYSPFKYVRRECPKCGDRYCGYDWHNENGTCVYCVDED